MKKIKVLNVVFVWGIIFSLLFLSQQAVSADKKQSLVKKIDHVLIAPTDIPGLINFFNEVLQLPVAWKYRSYGNFSSGGFYSGNANIEIIKIDAIRTGTGIGGIAFEPNGTTGEIVERMTQRNISFKAPVFHEDPKFKKKMKKENTWTTTDIINILPGSSIFLCEYHADSKKMASWKRHLQTKLDERNGGPLGIEYLSEIRLRLDESRIEDWRNLLAPVNEDTNNHVFVLGTGAAIRLVKSNDNCIDAIRFKVRSLDVALKYLKKCKIVGKIKIASISTNPDKTYGVLFEFSEILRRTQSAGQ